MPLDKNRIRALSASIAFVIAGGAVAGAAVFHVPVLGFGSAQSASAVAAPVRAIRATTRAVAPRKVLRIRYVDVIVHRPAPVRAHSTSTVRAGAEISSPRPTRSVAPAVTTTSIAAAPTPPATAPRSSARAVYTGSESEGEYSDDAPPGVAGPTTTTTMSEPTND